MKTPPDPESAWTRLLAQARADTPPPLDQAALLRAVRSEPLPTSATWSDDFLGLFAPQRVLPACLAGTGALALFASWEIWSVWQALPWAQLLVTTGGAP
ncbi:MAG: hypothetical protein HZA31_11990 [Opitutae bacterium]|nr:hypothetical protein [Opitutae bacterium]